MAKRIKRPKLPEHVSEEAMRAWVDRFVKAVNDPAFLVRFRHFEAAERAALSRRDAEARRLEELQMEERRLVEQLEAVRSHFLAARKIGDEEGRDKGPSGGR
ncbi:MAG TPA: hypothetical protein VH518_05525 [Tepidisphaeraceae bacterium]|jgi:hypothetical protein